MGIVVAAARHPPFPRNPPLVVQVGEGTALSPLASATTVTTSHQLHLLELAYSHHNRHVQAGGGTSLLDDTLELENGSGNCQKYMH